MNEPVEIKLKIKIPHGSKQLIEWINIVQRTIGFFKHLLSKSKIA